MKQRTILSVPWSGRNWKKGCEGGGKYKGESTLLLKKLVGEDYSFMPILLIEKALVAVYVYLKYNIGFSTLLHFLRFHPAKKEEGVIYFQSEC